MNSRLSKRRRIPSDPSKREKRSDVSVSSSESMGERLATDDDDDDVNCTVAFWVDRKDDDGLSSLLANIAVDGDDDDVVRILVLLR